MIKTLLKLIFAFGIVIWLIKSEKLDFSLVGQSLESGYSWLVAIGLMITQDIISATRWKWLLELKLERKIPQLKALSLTWIGLFFNSVLPGAVTGDLIKLVYARDLDKTKLTRTFLVTSALVDRIFGLCGLIVLLGCSTLAYYDEIAGLSPQMKILLRFNSFLFLGVVAFITTLFLPPKAQDKIHSLVEKVPFLGKKILMVFEQVWFIGKDKKLVIKCLMTSIFLQLLSVMAFWVLSSPFYQRDLPLPYVFTFIPIGFIVMAIPISPAGIGVGHLVFEQLYGYVGIQGGASLFNLFFLCWITVNFMGIVPYLLSGKKHSLEDASKFEETIAN